MWSAVEYYLTECVNNFDINQKMWESVCFTIHPQICFSSIWNFTWNWQLWVQKTIKYKTNEQSTKYSNWNMQIEI